MINITDKKDCCGCEACVQSCPKSCIRMSADEEGFLYPQVDAETCIDCGLCEKVCPVLNQEAGQKPIKTYAAKNPDKSIRLASSSGGVFTAVAAEIIRRGGVVFGAKFNSEWEVVHGYTDNEEELAAFRGSKYVQSRIGHSYKEAREFLKQGRPVLFTGTSCQIAGLHRFLRKKYSNLITIDVICHGAPSPQMWKDYLEYLARQKGVSVGKNTVSLSLNGIPYADGISFRDKTISWKKYGFSIRNNAPVGSVENSVSPSGNHKKTKHLFFEPLTENLFLRTFLSNLCLRPSCYSCPAKAGKAQSDLTIGDFWGVLRIKPLAYDSTGVSLVMVNTESGRQILTDSGLVLKGSDYNRAIRFNPAMERSTVLPEGRSHFWECYHKGGFEGIKPLVCTKPRPAYVRIFNRIKSLFH